MRLSPSNKHSSKRCAARNTERNMLCGRVRNNYVITTVKSSVHQYDSHPNSLAVGSLMISSARDGVIYPYPPAGSAIL